MGRKYRVVISWRPNINSAERKERTWVVSAPNKQTALVRAGWFMHMDGEYHVSDSLVIKEVTLIK